MSAEPQDLKRAAAKLRKRAKADAAAQQRLATASADFRERYLRWCMAEAQAECEREFRFVRMARDTVVPVFLEYIEPLGKSDRIELVRALCTKLHRPEGLDRRERQICERYDQFFTVPFRHPGGVLLPSTRVPIGLMERKERFSRRRSDAHEFRRALGRALKSVAGPEFGSMTMDHPTSISYEKQIGKWYLVTSFELGRREQLRYLHSFHGSPGGDLGSTLSSGISILNWTGIFQYTSWSWLLPEEIPETVESLRALCLYFLERAAELVAELPNPISS